MCAIGTSFEEQKFRRKCFDIILGDSFHGKRKSVVRESGNNSIGIGMNITRKLDLFVNYKRIAEDTDTREFCFVRAQEGLGKDKCNKYNAYDGARHDGRCARNFFVIENAQPNKKQCRKHMVAMIGVIGEGKKR